MSEKSVWTERETELLEQIHGLQTQLDQKVYVQGGDVWQTLYSYIISAQKQVSEQMNRSTVCRLSLIRRCMYREGMFDRHCTATSLVHRNR